MTAAKPLLAVLAGTRRQPPPCWFMRQAGRYLPEYRALRAQAGSFLDLCLAPAMAAEVTLQPVRRYGMDAAILFSDILIVPHALGQALDFREGEGPRLNPIRDAAAIGRLNPARAAQRWAPVLETVRQCAAALPAPTALIGFAGAPWTVASYMVEGGGSRDWAEVKTFAYRDHVTFLRLIELLVATTADYLSGQVEGGAEVIQLFDSWAGVLPPSAFHDFVIEPTTALVAILKHRHPTVPVIGFPRGAGTLLAAYVAATGVDAVSLDPTYAPAWVDANLPNGFPVQGNLDPILLVVGGEPMATAARGILAGFGNRPFIFNLGHGIPQPTPPQHLADLIAVIRNESSGRV